MKYEKYEKHEKHGQQVTTVWNRLIGVVMDEVGQPCWAEDAAQAKRPPVMPDGCAALSGVEIATDPLRLVRLLRAMMNVVAPGDVAPTGEDELTQAHALALLECAIRLDDLASSPATHPGGGSTRVASVAHLAVVPSLNACREAWPAADPGWSRGWCWICGAWPVLAEVRGLERSRQLRCGRCGADWVIPWLRCVFCDEHEFRHLGELVTADDPNLRKVDTCASCGGYLKSVPTLRALTLRELLVMDADTMALDVAALGKGFERPAAMQRSSGFRLVPKT
jgi:FdhE protein